MDIESSLFAAVQHSWFDAIARVPAETPCASLQARARQVELKLK